MKILEMPGAEQGRHFGERARGIVIILFYTLGVACEIKYLFF